jgi:hypothetical protein
LLRANNFTRGTVSTNLPREHQHHFIVKHSQLYYLLASPSPLRSSTSILSWSPPSLLILRRNHNTVSLRKFFPLQSWLLAHARRHRHPSLHSIYPNALVMFSKPFRFVDRATIPLDINFKAACKPGRNSGVVSERFIKKYLSLQTPLLCSPGADSSPILALIVPTAVVLLAVSWLLLWL